MKNKLSDLNNYLFAQLDKLGDPDTQGDELKAEIERSKAMSMIATNIIGSAKITVDAMKLVGKGDVDKGDMPLLIGN